MWFYAYFNISYLWIILASIVTNYVVHISILSNQNERKHLVLKKGVFFVGILFNIGLLFYYKYFNFFVDNLNYVAIVQRVN